MFKFLLLIISGLWIVQNCFAQSDTAHHLLPVQIQTSVLPADMQSITPVQILTGTSLETNNGLNVADAIRFFSGVHLKDYGGIGGLKTIDVQSMGTNHTSVFLNGIQLENAQNGQVDLSKISLDNLSKISLYNGQNDDILLPAKAFAGGASIFLQSKKPAFDSAQTFYVKMGAQTGSFGLFAPSVVLNKKLNNIFSGSLQLSSVSANGKYPFRYTNGIYDTSSIRRNDDLQSYKANLDINGKFKDSSELTINLFGFQREFGLPNAIVSNHFNGTQRQKDENYYLQFSYRKDIDKNYKIRISGKYANDYLRYSDPDIMQLSLQNGDSILHPLVNIYKQKELYLSVANQYLVNSFYHIDFSADISYNHLNSNITGFIPPSRWTTLLVLANQFELGDLQVQGNLLASFVQDRLQNSSKAASNKNLLAPMLAASWLPLHNKAFKIRAFYKRIFRMPTFNDLYYTQIGQIDLKPEYVNQTDLGLSYFKSLHVLPLQILLQLDGYHNQVSDKIVAIPGTNLFRWQMSNIGKVAIWGLDFSSHFAWKVSKWKMSTQLNYSYQSALDKTDPSSLSYNNQIPYIAKNSGSMVFNAEYRKAGFKYSFLYEGERYSQNYNSLINYVPAWYTHDLMLYYQLDIKRKFKTRIFFELNNILNQRYDIILNFPMPGRNYKVGMWIQI